MTSDEIKFMAKCEHRGACGRLVTMHAISHADPFDWCMCAECPHHEGHPRENARLEFENAKLRELAAEMYPYAKAFLQQGVMLGCTDSKSYDWYLQLHEMGIEVDG